MASLNTRWLGAAVAGVLELAAGNGPCSARQRKGQSYVDTVGCPTGTNDLQPRERDVANTMQLGAIRHIGGALFSTRLPEGRGGRQ